MPKVNLNTTRTTSIVDGKVVVSWEKTCPYCHKRFTTTSRTQKYCSDECCQKYNKRVTESRKRYDKIKEVERIRVRAHGLGVAIMDQLASMGVVEKKCACCGSTEKLELHHINNFNWLDNTPRNLQYLCTKCHHQVHADIESQLKADGKSLEDLYEPSMKLFYDIIGK